MSAVLLGLAGSNPIGLYPCFDEFYRKEGESSCSCCSKGRSIVCSEISRKAKFAKGMVQNCPYMVCIVCVQVKASKQKSCVSICEGKWLTFFSKFCDKPSLKIGAPDIVWL